MKSKNSIVQKNDEKNHRRTITRMLRISSNHSHPDFCCGYRWWLWTEHNCHGFQGRHGFKLAFIIDKRRKKTRNFSLSIFWKTMSIKEKYFFPGKNCPSPKMGLEVSDSRYNQLWYFPAKVTENKNQRNWSNVKLTENADSTTEKAHLSKFNGIFMEFLASFPWFLSVDWLRKTAVGKKEFLIEEWD